VTTHYELLGLEPDASRNEIRTAYRSRIDELDASLADPKRRNQQAMREEKAQLNAAWTVLADPYQRGRYDERLGAEEPEGDESTVGDVASGSPASTGRVGFLERMRRGAESFDRAETAGRSVAEPAPVMKRVGGAMIDVLVMTAIYAAVFAAISSRFELANNAGAYVGLVIAAVAIFAGATIWPVARRGQSLGHRLMGLEVVTDEGAPVNASVAVRRYSIPVALAALGGQLPVMLALLAGLSFLFSQHRVSILDRLAHTRVVVADG